MKISASYKGRPIAVIPADRGGDWLTFSLGGEQFGPAFRPTPNGISRAREWLRETGHDVQDNSQLQ